MRKSFPVFRQIFHPSSVRVPPPVFYLSNRTLLSCAASFRFIPSIRGVICIYPLPQLYLITRVLSPRKSMDDDDLIICLIYTFRSTIICLSSLEIDSTFSFGRWTTPKDLTPTTCCLTFDSSPDILAFETIHVVGGVKSPYSSRKMWRGRA